MGDMDDILVLPKKLFSKSSGFGFDTGGSCFKLAYTTDHGDDLHVHFAIYPTDQYKLALNFIKAQCGDDLIPGCEVTTCGIRANQQKHDIADILGITFRNVLEQEIQAMAINVLAKHLAVSDVMIQPNVEFVERGLLKAKLTNNALKVGSAMIVADSLNDVPETLEWNDTELQYPILMVNLGSVTHCTLVHTDGRIEPHQHHPVGGRAFLGLATLLTGHTEFCEVLSLAESGDHTQVDEILSDLGCQEADDSYSGFLQDGSQYVTTYSFGKALHTGATPGCLNKRDVLAAVMANITHVNVRDAVLTAAVCNVRDVVYHGSLPWSSQRVRDSITENYVFEMFAPGKKHVSRHMFIRHGAFIGALGSLMVNLGLK